MEISTFLDMVNPIEYDEKNNVEKYIADLENENERLMISNQSLKAENKRLRKVGKEGLQAYYRGWNHCYERITSSLELLEIPDLETKEEFYNGGDDD